MLLATAGLRVALVTTHLPLREVADAIDHQTLLDVTASCMAICSAISAWPAAHRSAVSIPCRRGRSSGPGRDRDHRAALDSLRAEGLDHVGTAAADTLFTPKHLEHCDAVLAMYHDQGLPVLKHKGFGAAVNVTWACRSSAPRSDMAPPSIWPAAAHRHGSLRWPGRRLQHGGHRRSRD